MQSQLLNQLILIFLTGNYKELVKDIDNYVQHVSLHLSNENQKLFAIADIILKDQENQVNNNLIEVDQEKL